MPGTESQAIVREAIDTIEEKSRGSSDGLWLEDLIVRAAPHIAEWDVEECWHWKDWPDRTRHFEGAVDKGIDIVAVRKSDGKRVAIQSKSRDLDRKRSERRINKGEVDKFSSISSGKIWAERWLVANGDNPLGKNALDSVPKEKPIKQINIGSDLARQLALAPSVGVVDGECPHCVRPGDDDVRQTRTCMQDEVLRTSVRILTDHEKQESGGLPPGEARGRIILPCGTGKTRIALRIVEALTRPGNLAVVLCPSIALVGQIRREFLLNAKTRLRTLSVCSDVTAGFLGKMEGGSGLQKDPTLDLSRVSANEIRGQVTTDAAEIADWIRLTSCEDPPPHGESSVSVIFGTYQSSHRVGSARTKTPAKPIFVDSISLGSARNSEYRLPNCVFGGGFQVKFRP